MRLLTCFTAFALFGLLIAAPSSKNERLIITESFFMDRFIKYTGQHDIVNLLVPLNSFNFDDPSDSSESNEIETDVAVFFVEADVQPDGSRVDQGLYMLKDGKAKKILEHGRDAAASGDNSKLVFFGAKDGLYVYNEKTNSADKYGPITDSIIAIAKEKEGDVIYILTEDHILYKVSNNGETKEKIEDVVDAQQIVVDYENNLFFITHDKQTYVRTADGIKKIEGLPEHGSYAKLVKPPFFLDDIVPLIIDNRVYVMLANGSSEATGFEFKPKSMPTAFAPEAALIQYYAKDKKIYEFNLLEMIVGGVVDELKSYIHHKESEIRTIASKSKGKKSKA